MMQKINVFACFHLEISNMHFAEILKIVEYEKVTLVRLMVGVFLVKNDSRFKRKSSTTMETMTNEQNYFRLAKLILTLSSQYIS